MNGLKNELMQTLITPLDEIKSLHTQIVAAGRTSLDKAIRVGELLTNLKASKPHGRWLEFVATDLPFSDRTASRYMACWENREKLKTDSVSDLASAYRMLAAGETHEILSSERPPRTVEECLSEALTCLTQVADEMLVNSEAGKAPIKQEDVVPMQAALSQCEASLQSLMRSCIGSPRRILCIGTTLSDIRSYVEAAA